MTATKPTCGELISTDGFQLPLKALHVDTVIVGMTATSTVRQRFANSGDTTIEATYVFPLPARAGVTDFVAYLGGRRVVGVLKERAQARADYEQALVAGQRAAIVEEDRPDVFSVRLGNVGPGEQAAIELRLTGPLAFEDGEATFRFPLVVAPRYTAGTPLPGDQTGPGLARDTDAVPDASRVTPPRLQDNDARPDVDIAMTLDGAGLAVSNPRASLPITVAEADGLTRFNVEPGAAADRDFVLRFDVERQQLSSSAVLVPDAEGDEGTWSVTVLPPAEPNTTPRDVVVLLDRSGSMNGWKMVAARRAAGRIVDMLDVGDRFSVLGFDDQIDTPTDLRAGLIAATDRNRFAAATWLGSLESRGGTEMAEPLRKAAQMLATSDANRLASVVLVTDGQISGEDHLLTTLAPVLGRTRVYCVGIDRAVNAGFLDRLARLGSGRSELVESEERLDEAMTRLARTIGRPALTDIRVLVQGPDVIDGSITPGRSPDAFAGVPCVISGRYRGRADSATFQVLAGDSLVASLPAHLVPKAVAVQTIWARSVVRDLEDEYASGYPDEELAARLVAHSLRFGVLSRFTAFVAVDPERTDAGPLLEVVQAVEMPSGWAPVRSFAAAMPAPAAMAVGRAVPGQHPPSAQAVPKRSLKDLLKLVQTGLGGDEPGLAGVWAELAMHRDAVSEPALAAALAALCDVLNRYLCNSTDELAAQVLEAVDAVKRLLPKRRFWR